MMPILVVDDSRDDLILVERILRHCQILNPIHCFSNPRQFLEHLSQTTAPGPDPALLLLDLMMEPLSGVDLLTELHAMGKAGPLFTVMMSGLSDFQVLHQGYQLGARTFLLKPLTPAEVLQMLRSQPALELQEVAGGCRLGLKTASQPHRQASQVPSAR